jgi:hypothetical protein
MTVHPLRPPKPLRGGRDRISARVGGIVIAGAMGVASSSRDLRTGPPQKLEIPVARIQGLPDRHDLCRTLSFHNDSGRYQDSGLGKCTIPDDMLIWTVSPTRAFAEAFKSAWKGDSSPPPR